MLKQFLKKIDNLCCIYLGLQKEVVRPNTVKMVNGNLIITTIESNKRHKYEKTWDEFIDIDFSNTQNKDREKLGVAVGKSIAKDLIVSFQETKIT